jgi:hypothetical protein
MLDDKRIIPKSELKEIERTLFINAFNSIQSLSRMSLFLEQNAQKYAENLLNKEAGANIALLLSVNEHTGNTEIQQVERDRYLKPLENALSVLVKGEPNQFIPLFISMLENEDEPVRRAAIEMLTQFRESLGDRISTVQEVVGRRIFDCRNNGCFRELHHLVDWWPKITGNMHELTHFANDVFAFVVKNDIEDEETAAYINLAKTVAKENNIEITTSALKIFLLNDGESQWLNYCIELPEESYDVDKIFEMNSHLVAKTVAQDIPLKIKKHLIIMFK